MNKLKEFLFKYKHAIVILYAPIYMTWFILLERRDQVDFTVIHCFVDDLIPFCEYFIFPYLSWFIYVGITLLFLFLQTKHLDDFYRCCACLLLGMTTCLFIYTIFPNAQDMRPTTFTRDNICTQIISILYATDTDTNVLPSIHVYNSIAIHIAIAKSHYFQDKRKVKIASLILCTLICISTLTLKQHSFLDLITALMLYIVYYIIVYKPFRQRDTANAAPDQPKPAQRTTPHKECS